VLRVPVAGLDLVTNSSTRRGTTGSMTLDI